MPKITLCYYSVQNDKLGKTGQNIQMTVNGVTECRSSLDMLIITVFLYLLQKETGVSCQLLQITLCSKSVQETKLENSSHSIQITVNGVTDCR